MLCRTYVSYLNRSKLQQRNVIIKLTSTQIETVQKFLHKKYENEDMSISNVKGKKVRSLGASSFFVVVPKAAMMHEHPKAQ